MRNVIVLGIGAAALYIMWKAFNQPIDANAVIASKAENNPCPDGQVMCEGSKKCFDPSINYLVDPCR